MFDKLMKTCPTVFLILVLTFEYSVTAQIKFDDSIVFEDSLRSEQNDSPPPQVENGTGILTDDGGKCSFTDAVTCCLTSVNLPCSEFNNNTYYFNTCGAQCGIPCIDDINVSDDVGVVIESADSVMECFDEKPAVCCEYVNKNDLCLVDIPSLTTGCRKTCQQCTSKVI